jgi:hypothetical protein
VQQRMRRTGGRGLGSKGGEHQERGCRGRERVLGSARARTRPLIQGRTDKKVPKRTGGVDVPLWRKRRPCLSVRESVQETSPP